MRFKIERKYIMWGLTAFSVILATMMVYALFFRIQTIIGILKNGASLLAPLIMALVIAYILNPLMKFLEEKVIGGIYEALEKEVPQKHKKIIRLISVILSLILMYAAVYGLIAMLVPQLIDSFMTLANNLPYYSRNAEKFIIELFEDNPQLKDDVVASLDDIMEALNNFLNTSLLPSVNSLVSKFSSSLANILGIVWNIIIGSLISIYFLTGKENFIARAKRTLYMLCGDVEFGNNLLRDFRYVEQTFGGFFMGKVIDSLIIGVICAISCALLKIPYVPLVSTIVGVTNIIPFFGPFIGAIPCSVLILMANPVKGITFIIMILILQQVDGNIIGPKILGDSTGLSSFMVIVAILLGSGLFGFAGMLLGVPVCAVIVQFISNYTEKKLQHKSLPLDVEAYKEMDYIDPESMKPMKKSGASDHRELFKYGVRGRRLHDPDTDDEVLRSYKIRKAHRPIHEMEEVTEDTPHLTAQDFINVEEVKK